MDTLGHMRAAMNNMHCHLVTDCEVAHASLRGAHFGANQKSRRPLEPFCLETYVGILYTASEQRLQMVCFFKTRI